MDDKAKLTVLKTHVKKMQKENENQSKQWESRLGELTEDLERKTPKLPPMCCATHGIKSFQGSEGTGAWTSTS